MPEIAAHNPFPLPDEVCAVLMIDQAIFLPILGCFNDPIALVQVFLTNGSCSDDSSEIEHGMVYTVGCPIVSEAARFFSSLVDKIGATNCIAQIGSCVTTFQAAFNAIFSLVQAGVDAVTPEMCPEWVSDDVAATTASP